MNAATILADVAADGLAVTLSSTGNLKVAGESETINRWRTVLQQRKAEIIDHLSEKPGGTRASTHTLPPFCRVDCPGLEGIDLPGEGSTPGCIHPLTGAWKRLDLLDGCPALRVSTAKPPALPKWCDTRCVHLHQLTVPVAGLLRWCFRETDEHHWNLRRIDTMKGCPAKEERR